MKITSVTPLTYRKSLLVKVDTDAGITGWGECSPMEISVIAATLSRAIAPHAIGVDPHDTEAVLQRIANLCYKINGQILWMAMSGLEIALWDILGKFHSVPVYKLLGGAVRKSIPLYASSMSRNIAPAQEADRMARLVEEFGFRAVKLKIGRRFGQDSDESPGRTEALVREVRARLGEGIAIMVDANSCYSAQRAIQVGRCLESYDIFHFEEPCPYLDIDSHAKVARALDVPIALGEQDWNPYTFKHILQAGAAAIIQPDIIKAGGFLPMKKLAALADVFGAVLTPHQTKPFGTIVNLHLGASTPAVRYFQEYNIEDREVRETFFRNAPPVIDGCMAVPEEPGLGVEFSEEVLRNLEGVSA